MNRHSCAGDDYLPVSVGYSSRLTIPYSQLISLIKLRTNSHHLEAQRTAPTLSGHWLVLRPAFRPPTQITQSGSPGCRTCAAGLCINSAFHAGVTVPPRAHTYPTVRLRYPALRLVEAGHSWPGLGAADYAHLVQLRADRSPDCTASGPAARP
jgi:hypothetical protein